MALSIQYAHEEKKVGTFADFVGKGVKALRKAIDSFLCEAPPESLLDWLDKFPKVYLNTTEYPITLEGSEADLVKMVSNVDMFWEFIQEVKRLYDVSYINFRVTE
jgi:hypothetical protein